MSIGRNHEMAWVIRKNVENHKTRFTAKKYKSLFIVLFLREIAKNTSVLIF